MQVLLYLHCSPYHTQYVFLQGYNVQWFTWSVYFVYNRTYITVLNIPRVYKIKHNVMKMAWQSRFPKYDHLIMLW